MKKTHLLGLPPALEDEDVSVDVLHADPAGQRQGGVGPHPVHHGSQLRQERHQAETGSDGRSRKEFRFPSVTSSRWTLWREGSFSSTQIWASWSTVRGIFRDPNSFLWAFLQTSVTFTSQRVFFFFAANVSRMKSQFIQSITVNVARKLQTLITFLISLMNSSFFPPISLKNIRISFLN